MMRLPCDLIAQFLIAAKYRREAVLGVALMAILSTVMGCSDGRPARLSVSGQVLIDGKPLQMGSIKFVPEGARPSSGKIDENGRFTLTCYDGGDGVVPGTHRVQVSSMEVLSASKVRWMAPPKYADFRNSGLTYELTEPTDDLKIELTWDGGKPFVQ
jgi:hypothetical protein